MKSVTSSRVRVLAGVAVLAAAAGLAGCSAHPGKAAVVEFTDADGVTHSSSVSEAELSEACDELSGVGAQCEQVLGMLESLPVYEYLADKYGVTVSEEEVTQALATISPDGGDFSAATRDALRVQVLGGKLSAAENVGEIAQEFQTMASSAVVEVSPRYRGTGPWIVQPGQSDLQIDPSQGVDPSQSGEQGSDPSQDGQGEGTQGTDH